MQKNNLNRLLQACEISTQYNKKMTKNEKENKNKKNKTKQEHLFIEEV